ncbi:RNA polymerase sigma factor [Alicyclobacillus fastidiosus]|uniref:Sigma-70 family RNA polymerase sigma factor n=1 Tax=Alicyclobacillus fastidiosus TaxID=392011 RepID=A0ABV5ALC0_9BACL|nr:sigma-70 family RNA polymerase sigma factor [Alicyclobacillus fastidiosus]WEH08495.1 sigma-70 family RNA polymerase sigma factor [Alicyclobacillus fastidiosus]
MDFKDELSGWIDNYGDQLLRIACSYIHDRAAAEDCLQDAFVKAYKKTSQLKNRDRPFPWLARIVINECKSRSRKNKELVLPILPEQEVHGPETIVMEKVRSESIQMAINSLPEKYRTPIVLHYFHDLRLEVIAEILGEKSGTIRTRVSRARERLKVMLEVGETDESRRTITEI